MRPRLGSGDVRAGGRLSIKDVGGLGVEGEVDLIEIKPKRGHVREVPDGTGGLRARDPCAKHWVGVGGRGERWRSSAVASLEMGTLRGAVGVSSAVVQPALPTIRMPSA